MDIKNTAEKYAGVLAFLNNYNIALTSRNFMLNNHEQELYKILEEKEKGKPKEGIDFIEMSFYKEMFEKVCIAIEDFCDIIYALSMELNLFNKNIISQPNPQNILKSINQEKLKIVFKHRDLDGLRSEEKTLIENLRKRNFDTVLEFIDILIKFIDENWIIYTKIKHGNTVIYGMEKINICGFDTFIMPVFYNTKSVEKPKLLILNYSVYRILKDLFVSLQGLSNDLCVINYNYICRNEEKFIINNIYFSMNENDIQKTKMILERYDKGVFTRLNVSVQLNTDMDKIHEVLDFYSNYRNPLNK